MINIYTHQWHHRSGIRNMLNAQKNNYGLEHRQIHIFSLSESYGFLGDNNHNAFEKRKGYIFFFV